MMRSTMLALALCCADAAACQDGRELFPRDCATCHGPTGRGDGPTVVEPRPGELTSGRFSFGELQTSSEIDTLVGYARSLTPLTVEATPDESRVAFGATPRIVRGFLPPRPGADAPVARGLVVGLPSRLALEYATADFRLMRVLVGGPDGAFVDRTDWRGRGGTPLELLGKPIDEPAEHDFGPTFETVPDSIPLSIDLHGVRVIDDTVRFDGRVLDGEAAVARYLELIRSITVDGDASGVHRRIEIHGARVPRSLRVSCIGMKILRVWRRERVTLRGLEIWYGGRQPDGTAELIGFRGPQVTKGTLRAGVGKILVPVGDRPFTRVDVVRVRRPGASFTVESIPAYAEGFDR